MALIRPHGAKTDSLFLAKQLGHSRVVRYFGRMANGVTRYGLGTAAIANLPIWLPPLDYQNRAALVFATIDETIAQTQALIAKLQRIRAGLLHDLLTRGIDENGELRDPTEHPDQFRVCPLGRIPTAWDVRRLRDCLLLNPQNGIYKPASEIGRGTLLVGQTSFTEERGVDFSLARRAVVTDAELERYGLSQGDVLVSRVFATINGVGQPAIVPNLEEPAVYESNMMRLRVDRKIIAPELVFHWLRCPSARRHVRATANLSNQASINQTGLNSLAIAVPEREEQSRILLAIVAHEDRQEHEQALLRKLCAIRSGLMHDLLTGKVRVPSRETMP